MLPAEQQCPPENVSRTLINVIAVIERRANYNFVPVDRDRGTEPVVRRSRWVDQATLMAPTLLRPRENVCCAGGSGVRRFARRTDYDRGGADVHRVPELGIRIDQTSRSRKYL